MDRQNATVASLEVPTQPHQSTTSSGGRRFAFGDVEHACGIARTVVATALAQPQPCRAGTRPRTRAAAFARQTAMYLAHVGFGFPMAEIGKAFGRDRTTVVHACHLIEDRRDEAGFDVMLDHLEQAAIALAAATRLNRQD